MNSVVSWVLILVAVSLFTPVWGWGSSKSLLLSSGLNLFNESQVSLSELSFSSPSPFEIILAQTFETTTNQTKEISSNTATNEVHFVPTNTQPTIWERYYSTTSTHPLRRADVLFFISIPFTILWADFLIQRFRDYSVIGAYLEGVRGTENLKNINFTYYHDTYPASIDDPFYVFKWVNAFLWPLVIVSNDFLERVSDPVKWEKEKEEMIDNRFHLNLIYYPNH